MSDNASAVCFIALVVICGLGSCGLRMRWLEHAQRCRAEMLKLGLDTSTAKDVCPW